MEVKMRMEVVTEMAVTEGVGPLGPQEVRLVALVLEQVRHGAGAHRAKGSRHHHA